MAIAVRKAALIIEFTSLGILILWLLWVAEMKPQESRLTLANLTLPFTASFFVLAGFITDLYFRWIKNTEQKRNTVHLLLFCFLALCLLGVWAVSLMKTITTLG
ncbi:hypothetical protein OLMES_4884 [Oleiphilus messinensis]|uniref:Uncharacterized protein n=1 Tax=Oleiphilus messinensis TaxID=141451 RepID=A0A1Y0IED8_9GAMM|nr:hypothetical protein [Oleiphilus messinensis]ARU58872.1 hypothetical protein OLMES_4884 [Oleiphilus messinensis]